MDKYAHQTLLLRSFYRQFDPDDVPEDYYEVLRGNLSEDKLYKKWPETTGIAKQEAWNAKLGFDEESEDPATIDERINQING